MIFRLLFHQDDCRASPTLSGMVRSWERCQQLCLGRRMLRRIGQPWYWWYSIQGAAQRLYTLLLYQDGHHHVLRVLRFHRRLLQVHQSPQLQCRPGQAPDQSGLTSLSPSTPSSSLSIITPPSSPLSSGVASLGSTASLMISPPVLKLLKSHYWRRCQWKSWSWEHHHHWSQPGRWRVNHTLCALLA